MSFIINNMVLGSANMPQFAIFCGGSVLFPTPKSWDELSLLQMVQFEVQPTVL